MGPGGTLAGSSTPPLLIDLEHLDVDVLAAEAAVSSLAMAELAAGPHATAGSDERSRRQDRLQRAEAAFDPLPFDTNAARAHGSRAAELALRPGDDMTRHAGWAAPAPGGVARETRSVASSTGGARHIVVPSSA